LILRTPDRWYPISSLETFKKEVGEDGLKVAIEALCSFFTQPMANENSATPDVIDTVKLEPPEGDLVIKQEDPPEIIDLTMDLDDEDIKPNFATALPLTTPLTKDFFDMLWPQIAGTSQLPQPADPIHSDPIHSLFASDISTITMNSFCQDESIMTTREILDRINRDQLVALAKEMKCALRPNSKA
jgi:Fanconi-associated nuclease 1